MMIIMYGAMERVSVYYLVIFTCDSDKQVQSSIPQIKNLTHLVVQPISLVKMTYQYSVNFHPL